MLIALVIMNFMHPAKVLRGPESSFGKPWRWYWKRKAGDGSGVHRPGSSSIELNSRRNAEEQPTNAQDGVGM